MRSTAPKSNALVVGPPASVTCAGTLISWRSTGVFGV